MAAGLPIVPLLPEVRATLTAAPNLVLEAPPGAGKTTLVPLALLPSAWRKPEGRILVLEPRRLAARAAAARMAELLGEAVGATIGYRLRLERRIGPKTRIEVLTTGLFLRRIQEDPALEDVSAILFDEFHERAIDSDLALALALDSQAGLRPDLRLVVMSATLDGGAVQGLMPGARLIKSEGRVHPVETRYLGDGPQDPTAARIETRMGTAIRRALAEEDGDILAFLPGAAEIRRTAALLADACDESLVAILPLHGDLALAEQDCALAPDARGRRKVILASAIAETSLTIDGVHIVVDSGLRRAPRYDPATGMTRLATERAPIAAAEQRRGRAGRTGPGICYRLWSQASERALPAFAPPEIREADLAPLALELAAWGVRDTGALALLDQPDPVFLRKARDLLRQLGALDNNDRITAHGRAMAKLGAHPRLAHLMAAAKTRDLGSLGADIAAILSERDMLKRGAAPDADLAHRLDLLYGHDRPQDGAILDRAVRERVRRSAEAWRGQLGVPRDSSPPRTEAGALLMLAYPDRIAQRRPASGAQDAGLYRLSGGGGGRLDAGDPLLAHTFLAVGSIDGQKKDGRIFLAAPVTAATIEAEYGAFIETRDSLAWNARLEAIEARREKRLWSLVLETAPLTGATPTAMTDAMLEGVRQMGLDALPWTAATQSFRDRIAFLRRHQMLGIAEPDYDWPDLSDAALLENLPEWLGPFLEGCSRRAHLGKIDLFAALAALLDWRHRQALDKLAPPHLVVPSGSAVPLDYAAGEVPVLAVRLQEMFGATETPRILGGRVEILLHLLSPARRPVQVTRDLKSFWATGYRQVKADLKGQYPKHHWPDDPLAALPTARTKRRDARG